MWDAPHAREGYLQDGAGTDVMSVPLAVSQSRFAQEEAKTPDISGARPQRTQRRQKQGQVPPDVTEQLMHLRRTIQRV